MEGLNLKTTLQEGRVKKMGCLVHLLIFDGEMICELMIAEGNKQKHRAFVWVIL
jgi:hypothetical protein